MQQLRSNISEEIHSFMKGVQRRNPGEPEFLQAVREVVEDVMPYVVERPEYREAQILERMTEPDRIVVFRVTWEDDEGRIRAAAVRYGVPCVTTLPGCVAMVQALRAMHRDPTPRVRALQDWIASVEIADERHAVSH